MIGIMWSGSYKNNVWILINDWIEFNLIKYTMFEMQNALLGISVTFMFNTNYSPALW